MTDGRTDRQTDKEKQKQRTTTATKSFQHGTFYAADQMILFAVYTKPIPKYAYHENETHDSHLSCWLKKDFLAYQIVPCSLASAAFATLIKVQSCRRAKLGFILKFNCQV